MTDNQEGNGSKAPNNILKWRWFIRYPIALVLLGLCLWVGGDHFPENLLPPGNFGAIMRYGAVAVGIIWALLLAREIILITLGIMLLYWIGSEIQISSPFKKDEWEGFVYPDANDLLIHQNLGVFPSLTECRYAALYRLAELNASETGTYECGLNCRFEDGWETLKICEETTE